MSFNHLFCIQRRDDFSIDDDQAVPTKEGIEREEEKLEEVQQAQKNLFLIIFQVTLAENRSCNGLVCPGVFCMVISVITDERTRFAV